jgi:hypothetical protein
MGTYMTMAVLSFLLLLGAHCVSTVSLAHRATAADSREIAQWTARMKVYTCWSNATCHSSKIAALWIRLITKIVWLCIINFVLEIFFSSLWFLQHQNFQHLISSSVLLACSDHSSSGTTCLIADHSGRAVEGMNCFHPFERWDRGFQLKLSHGYLCAYILCLCWPVCR